MARFDGTRSEDGTEFLVTSFELDLTARVHFASAMAAFATGIDQPAPTAGMNLWGVFGVTIADLECEALGTLFVDAKMRRPVRLELLADVVQYSSTVPHTSSKLFNRKCRSSQKLPKANSQVRWRRRSLMPGGLRVILVQKSSRIEVTLLRHFWLADFKLVCDSVLKASRPLRSLNRSGRLAFAVVRG